MVDELLTWTKLRDQWQNFEDLFRAAWYDSSSRTIYYLKNPGGLIFGQATPNAYGCFDPPRTVAAINQFNLYEIRNPATSGVRLKITSVTVAHSAARQFRVIVATTTQASDLGTALTAPAAKAPEMPAAKAVPTNTNAQGSFAISGTTTLHVEQLQALVVRDYVQQGIEVPPGFAVFFSLGDTTDAAGESSTFSAEWIEY